MTLLAPWFALAALAALPIVLLHLLKRKRQELRVPSTLLWRQALEDLKANVPLQRLRANLLLILQLLILGLLVLALMRPALPSGHRLGPRSVLVMDTSASMLARDVGGGTRFDRARRLARSLIESLEAGQRLMILAGGRQVTDGFLDDPGRLRDALDRLEPVEAESNVDRDLELAYSFLAADVPGEADGGAAAGVARGNRILLVSDGAGLTLPAEPKDLASVLRYYAVGTGGENAAIIGLEFRRPAERSDRGQLFVGVANFGGAARSVLVSLRRRGEAAPIDAAELTLESGQSSGVTFERQFAAGQYVMALSGDDVLAVDNKAFLVLGENRPLRVMLVSRGNAVVERLLSAAAQVEAVRVDPAAYRSSEAVADLYVFDRAVPDEPPRGRTAVFLAPPGPVGDFVPEGVQKAARVFDWNRDDPVMRFVSMSDVRLAEGSAMSLAAGPKVVPLVWAESGPLVAVARAGSVRHYCVAFDILQSTWPKSVSFPIFLGNVLAEARAAQRLSLALTGKTGRPWRMTQLALGETVRVKGPSGETFAVPAADVTADFRRTDRAGFYTVRSRAGESVFALNLESVRESAIAPRGELSGSGGATVPGRTRLAGGTREIWPWAAAAAVALLLVEWIVYHRRIA